MTRPDPESAAREFDRWADAGRAESMADGHRGITEAAIEHWTLDSDATVLDVGCGNGWAVQWLVERGAGRGVGVDIAPKMIARANAATKNDARFVFHVASADALPLNDASVSHVLNVESLYYYPDPAAAVAEWARVTQPGGELVVVVDLYAENVATHAWIEALDVDVHLLSAQDCVDMAVAAGWRNVRAWQVRDPRPLKSVDAFEPSRYWPSYEMYVDYRRTGALVVAGWR
jgi:SAM-dependent methyltransferase